MSIITAPDADIGALIFYFAEEEGRRSRWQEYWRVLVLKYLLPATCQEAMLKKLNRTSAVE